MFMDTKTNRGPAVPQPPVRSGWTSAEDEKIKESRRCFSDGVRWQNNHEWWGRPFFHGVSFSRKLQFWATCFSNRRIISDERCCPDLFFYRHNTGREASGSVGERGSEHLAEGQAAEEPHFLFYLLAPSPRRTFLGFIFIVIVFFPSVAFPQI